MNRRRALAAAVVVPLIVLAPRIVNAGACAG
jgi:hypothetical protein